MGRQIISLLVVAFAVCLLMGGHSVIGDLPESNDEVHVVSIYEGLEQTGGQIHGPRAHIHVDRPGKRLILVLTSYSGATWHVTTSKETRVRQVILGGYEEQAVKGVAESTEIVKAWRGESHKPLYYSYKAVGPNFRQLVKQIHALTGTELSSFHGRYRPESNAPFVIDAVQEDPQISSSYPQPTPLSEFPPGARDVKFVAHHYVSGRHRHELASSFGEYTLSGPIENTLQPLPDGVSRITYDPIDKVHYGISGHGVVKIGGEANDVKPIKLGLNVPRLSWPCEVTFDTKRKRVILGSSGGGGYLYAYSTEKQQWSVISKRPGALDAFVYSPADDFIYGVLFEHSDEGNVASLAKVNPEGAIVSRLPLGPPIHPGSLNTGPGVCTTQVAIAGNYIAILASPGGLGPNFLDAASIYLFDPATKKVWLTSKKSAGN